MPKSAKRHPKGRKPPSRISKRATAVRKTARPAEVASQTKQSRAIAMLRSDSGATISDLMEATGWQQHSVRGFLAGVVRKRLGLKLASSKVDGCRIYRIVGDGRAEPPAPESLGN